MLTQSVSSAFLRNPKNGELLYQFFLLASGLQPLRITYREAQKQAPPHCLRTLPPHRLRLSPHLRLHTASAPPLQVEDARVKLDAHQAQKPKMQEAVAAQEKLVQEARQREDATAQLAQLDHEIALGQADEREKALEGRGRQAEGAARAEEDAGEALVAAEKAQEELRRRNEAQLKQAEEQKAEQCASEMRLRDTTKALKAKQRDVKQLETQKKELAEKVEDAAATLQQAQVQKAAKVAAQRKEERRANEQLARQQEQLGATAASKKRDRDDAERELSAAKQAQQGLQAAATKEGHARAQAQRVAREAELELKNKLAARDKNALIKYGARSLFETASSLRDDSAPLARPASARAPGCPGASGGAVCRVLEHPRAADHPRSTNRCWDGRVHRRGGPREDLEGGNASGPAGAARAPEAGARALPPCRRERARQLAHAGGDGGAP